jgi:hypothetical protein
VLRLNIGIMTYSISLFRLNFSIICSVMSCSFFAILSCFLCAILSCPLCAVLSRTLSAILSCIYLPRSDLLLPFPIRLVLSYSAFPYLVQPGSVLLDSENCVEVGVREREREREFCSIVFLFSGLDLYVRLLRSPFLLSPVISPPDLSYHVLSSSCPIMFSPIMYSISLTYSSLILSIAPPFLSPPLGPYILSCPLLMNPRLSCPVLLLSSPVLA